MGIGDDLKKAGKKAAKAGKKTGKQAGKAAGKATRQAGKAADSSIRQSTRAAKGATGAAARLTKEGIDAAAEGAKAAGVPDGAVDATAGVAKVGTSYAKRSADARIDHAAARAQASVDQTERRAQAGAQLLKDPGKAVDPEFLAKHGMAEMEEMGAGTATDLELAKDQAGARLDAGGRLVDVGADALDDAGLDGAAGLVRDGKQLAEEGAGEARRLAEQLVTEGVEELLEAALDEVLGRYTDDLVELLGCAANLLSDPAALDASKRLVGGAVRGDHRRAKDRRRVAGSLYETVDRILPETSSLAARRAERKGG